LHKDSNARPVDERKETVSSAARDKVQSWPPHFRPPTLGLVRYRLLPLFVLTSALALLLSACFGDDPDPQFSDPTAIPTDTPVPTPTNTPQPAAPSASASPVRSTTLAGSGCGSGL